jgi:hypothetical protein
VKAAFRGSFSHIRPGNRRFRGCPAWRKRTKKDHFDQKRSLFTSFSVRVWPLKTLFLRQIGAKNSCQDRTVFASFHPRFCLVELAGLVTLLGPSIWPVSQLIRPGLGRTRRLTCPASQCLLYLAASDGARRSGHGAHPGHTHIGRHLPASCGGSR